MKLHFLIHGRFGAEATEGTIREESHHQQSWPEKDVLLLTHSGGEPMLGQTCVHRGEHRQGCWAQGIATDSRSIPDRFALSLDSEDIAGVLAKGARLVVVVLGGELPRGETVGEWVDGGRGALASVYSPSTPCRIRSLQSRGEWAWLQNPCRLGVPVVWGTGGLKGYVGGGGGGIGGQWPQQTPAVWGTPKSGRNKRG